jgi:hypothetical protein
MENNIPNNNGMVENEVSSDVGVSDDGARSMNLKMANDHRIPGHGVLSESNFGLGGEFEDVAFEDEYLSKFIAFRGAVDCNLQELVRENNNFFVHSPTDNRDPSQTVALVQIQKLMLIAHYHQQATLSAKAQKLCIHQLQLTMPHLIPIICIMLYSVLLMVNRRWK